MTRRGRRTLAGTAALALVLAVGVGGGRWLAGRGLSVSALAADLQDDGPRLEWRSIDKKHWQAAPRDPRLAEELPEETDLREGTSRGCPAGMVHVKGAFRDEAKEQATGAIERLQDAACTDWISREFPARCRSFDAEKIAASVASLPTTPIDVCVDRFEYPNVHGQSPMIVVTFHEAEAICARESKRLCTENEWTFACEGEEVSPYPYGFTRDDEACVMDRPWRAFTEGALQPRDGERARKELDALWQGEPSGSRPLCRSPFGVYDLTGNVDEWTRSVNPTGYRSILKGGYWGPVRARCRPATRAHNEDFIAYQQSFRCCAAPVEERGEAREEETFSADAGADAAGPELADDAGAPLEGPDVDAGGDDEMSALREAGAPAHGCFAPAIGGKTRTRAASFPLGAVLLLLARRRRAGRR